MNAFNHMQKPKPLQEGDTIALISPSSPVPPDRLEPAVDAVHALGFHTLVYDSCKQSHGYLSGSDEQRAADFNNAFENPEVDGIFCIRGGYGSGRLMNLLDYQMIARHPKYFSGYSDTTGFHIALNQNCHLCTFHTPMPSTEYYKEIGEYSMNSMKQMIFGNPISELLNPVGTTMSALVCGNAQGTLIGGNLSLVVSSIGTAYEIDTKGKILFLEDVHEEPYRIDRMLLQLRDSGKFRDCAGILLGAFTDCQADDPEKSLTIQQVLEELIVPAGKPTMMDLVCGHCLPTMSLPLGATVAMDGRRIRVIE